MTTPHEDSVPSVLASVPRLFMMWLFGDVVLYAVIPIGVLGLLIGLLGHGGDGLWLLKEWSFANIVFFGTSIRRLTRLKVKLQRTPHSYKLDTGVQLFIVMLIAATLTLALVVLREWKIVPEAAEPLLRGAQQLLFVMGILATVTATFQEEQYHDTRHALAPNTPPPADTKPSLLRQAMHASEQACDRLSFAATAAQRASELSVAVRPSRSSMRNEGRLVAQLLTNVEAARDLVNEALGSIRSLSPSKGT